MLDYLVIALVTAGLIIILSHLSVKYVTNRYLGIISQLIKMNEVDGFDPVMLLRHLEPFLKKAGIIDFGYYLFYHNVEYVRRNVSQKKSMTKFVHTAEYTVYIDIVPGFRFIESDFITKVLVEVIFLLLKADVNIQTTAAQKAFRKSVELQTFINHDVKNLIQFVNVLEFNLKQVEDDAGYRRLVRYMQKSLPGLKVRADKILSALNSTQPEMDSLPEKLTPMTIVSDAAGIYGVSIHSATPADMVITARKRGLTVIIENIIKNFYDKSISERGISLFVDVSENDSGYVMKFRDTGSPIADCEKIFEPFFSGKVNGLGIGLFHCRNVAAGMGGKLTAENTGEGPVFMLVINR
ncbi:MAG: sensor histidine kinase [Deferribacterales bacterium]